MELTSINTLFLSGPGSNANEEVLSIPQSFRTEASPSDGLVSSRTLNGGEEPYLSVEMLLVTRLD